MTTGMSTLTANGWLSAVGRNTAWNEAATYLQLHVGDPGSAGTANQAQETTRKAVSWGTAVTGTIATDADIQWTSITGSQTATYWSLWDASSGGNFLGSGSLTNGSYTTGGTLTIPSGTLSISLTVASASLIGWANGVANELLGTLDNSSYQVGAGYLKLHTGNPGADGTSNAASENVRQQVTFAAPSNGVMLSSNSQAWASITGSQTATHFSVWTASSGGIFVYSGTLSAAAYTAGSSFTIATGAVRLSLSRAA